MIRRGTVVTPAQILHPGAAGNYVRVNDITMFADSSYEWRVECQRPPTGGNYRPTESPCVFWFASDSLGAYFVAEGGSLPYAYAMYDDLEVAGFPSPGDWVQISASWDQFTDVLTLSWRRPGPDLLDDDGWVIASAIYEPGAVMDSTRTNWLLGGTTSYAPMVGGVRRWVRRVNFFLEIDVNASTGLVDVGGNLSLVADTGQSLNVFSAGSPHIELVEASHVEGFVDVTPIAITTAPSADLVADFMAPHIEVVRWVDIYEADGVTSFSLGAPMTNEGSVTVDAGRPERRNVQLTLVDDGTIGYGPIDGLWYDKILKPWWGIELQDGTIYASQLGEFMIDTIERPRFPAVMKVTGRDYTKKLKADKFAETTTFPASGETIDQIVRTIALNGGITRFALSPVSTTLSAPITWEKDTERWAAIEKLAESVAHEVFFDRHGQLVMRPYVDPATAVPSFTFATSGNESNVADYTRKTGDAELFNDIVVRGSGQSNGLVVGRATDEEPNSPTNIERVGRRTMPAIENPIVATNAEADRIARRILAVAGLESYDVSLTSLVAPWLEVSDVVGFTPAEDAPEEPTEFLLTSFTIPFALGAMSANAKRIFRIPAQPGTYGYGTYGGGTYGEPA